MKNPIPICMLIATSLTSGCFAFQFSLIIQPGAAGASDTVVLTTGEVIEGNFLGANEQAVQIQDKRGIVENISREHVSTIRLAHTTNSTETPQPQPNQSPAEQRQFCALVERFQHEQIAYFQETNPIRKPGMPQPDPFRYEPEVQAIFGDEHKFSRWTGTLRFSTSGRSIGIVFTPDCQPAQMTIQLANAMEQPGLPTQDPATVIHTNSPIGQTLARAKSSNQSAIVSGTLVPIRRLARFNQALQSPSNGRALYRSTINAAGASVAQPNYLVHFTSVVISEENQR